MRKTLSVLTAVCFAFVVSASSRADDEADARAIVAKSIKALGGEEKLAKFNAHSQTESGTYYGMGDGLPYVGKYSVQWPHQFKVEIVGVFVMVVNGDKGWMQANGETREMASDELKNYQEDHYAGWLTTLVPLKDKKYKLATTGEVKIENRPAMGVRVSADKHQDVHLFFDKESSLLVKSEHRVISGEQGNKEVTQTAFYSGYKEIEGVKIATKYLIKRDGEKYVEAEATDITPVTRFDDSVFAKP